MNSIRCLTACHAFVYSSSTMMSKQAYATPRYIHERLLIVNIFFVLLVIYDEYIIAIHGVYRRTRLEHDRKYISTIDIVEIQLFSLVCNFLFRSCISGRMNNMSMNFNRNVAYHNESNHLFIVLVSI
jgi:hypothetical protein